MIYVTYCTCYMCHPTFTDKKVRQQLVAICFATTLTPFVKPCEVLRGYLDVAIAKKFAKLACNLVLWIRDLPLLLLINLLVSEACN